MTTCPALTFRYHFHRHAKKKKRQKQKTMVALPMCWSFFIIWRSCTHSSERLKMRYESLKNVAMHFKVFKCVKNAFHSSAVSHTPTFWAKDVWCYDAYFLTNYVKETVTQLEKDKTALADQYTWVTPLPYLYKWLSQLLKATGFSPFCRWCKFILKVIRTLNLKVKLTVNLFMHIFAYLQIRFH